MTNKETKINNWGILNLFISYLKHNRAIIISLFLIPLLFILPIVINYNSSTKVNATGPLIVMLLWLVQSSSFAIQTFLSILLDFKQTIIYRRIGLTRIKTINFLFISSIFNLVLMSISNLFSFLVIIIIAAIFKDTNLITSLFQWQMLIIILFTLVCLILLTSISLLMSILIKTRTGQTIAALIVNFLIIILLFILIIFINTITNNTNQIISSINIGALIGILFVIFFLIISISTLLYYLSWKIFKWYE